MNGRIALKQGMSRRLKFAIVFYLIGYVIYLALCWAAAYFASWELGMVLLSIQYCYGAWRILEMHLRGG